MQAPREEEEIERARKSMKKAGDPAVPPDTLPGDRLADPEEFLDDREIEGSLRPRSLDAFIGQPVLREQLKIFIQATLARGEPLDHVLLAGPAGPGQDHAGQHHRGGDGRQHRDHVRAGP